jgi:nucleotide-binding universal stress UspA family protein
MRLLVVIADELLLGRNEAREWAFLESLVAASSPDRLEAEVLVLISEPTRSFAFANPLGQGVDGMAASGAGSPSVPHDPAGSARQRLDRAEQHLRSLGIHVTGDVVSGSPYRIVRDKTEAESYDLVLLLLNDRRSPMARIAGRSLEARLRRVLGIPVEALSRPELGPPGE